MIWFFTGTSHWQKWYFSELKFENVDDVITLYKNILGSTVKYFSWRYTSSKIFLVLIFLLVRIMYQMLSNIIRYILIYFDKILWILRIIMFDQNHDVINNIDHKSIS